MDVVHAGGVRPLIRAHTREKPRGSAGSSCPYGGAL